jgi:hypothetical protein
MTVKIFNIESAHLNKSCTLSKNNDHSILEDTTLKPGSSRGSHVIAGGRKIEVQT